MASPNSGFGGPTLNDATVRRMIAKIVSAPSPPALKSPGANTPGLNSFQQEQAKLRKYFGSSGGSWPEPGLSHAAHDYGVPDDVSLKLDFLNQIEQNYTLAIGGGGTVLPHEDPGRAVPGVGPIPGISSVLDFLKRLWSILTSKAFWLRAVEVLLGAGLVLAGLAKMSGAADKAVKAIPVAGKVLT
jgi:hypothetical protein